MGDRFDRMWRWALICGVVLPLVVAGSADATAPLDAAPRSSVASASSPAVRLDVIACQMGPSNTQVTTVGQPAVGAGLHDVVTYTNTSAQQCGIRGGASLEVFAQPRWFAPAGTPLELARILTPNQRIGIPEANAPLLLGPSDRAVIDVVVFVGPGVGCPARVSQRAAAIYLVPDGSFEGGVPIQAEIDLCLEADRVVSNWSFRYTVSSVSLR